jgi:glycosyltransferase involved in cell wall biosynthesis
MRIVHLTASGFFGGPERQMLELAASLPDNVVSTFVSFRESGGCRQFLAAARKGGFEGVMLQHDTPRFHAAVAELRAYLRRCRTDVLCCHGYKADILGQLAARLTGVHVLAVSRGWTGESRKVRLYEALDRLVLRGMDRVVCVSTAQAARVRQAGVPSKRLVVIANAIRVGRFGAPESANRERLDRLFPRRPDCIVAAAGRLSPEKGFSDLLEAARQVKARSPATGFVLFGDGPLRESLGRQIDAAGLVGRFVLAGFRNDLDGLLPNVDVLVAPSLTEGLPNVVLEAMAAAVPVVATTVGGLPELVEDGRTGFLVPAANPAALASCLGQLLDSAKDRLEFGAAGRHRVARHFSFEAQALAYEQLFADLVQEPAPLAA